MDSDSLSGGSPYASAGGQFAAISPPFLSLRGAHGSNYGFFATCLAIISHPDGLSGMRKRHFSLVDGKQVFPRDTDTKPPDNLPS